DYVGLRDFALYDGGANFIPSWTSQTFKPYGATGDSVSYGPHEALDANLQVGHCWPLSGASGQLGIALPEPINITHATIDHVPKVLAPDITTAPRHFSLWGYSDKAPSSGGDLQVLREGDILGDWIIVPDGGFFILLVTAEYDVTLASHIQTFPVPSSVTAHSPAYHAAILDISSNWGSLQHTCLYRVRIHGHP
ncbi:Sad1/UNC-like protein, partial [Sistotremastrum niveocremeum HHB9708]